MTNTLDDEIEARLRELFDRQAAAMPVDSRAGDATPMAAVIEVEAHRNPRTALVAIVTVAAAIALVIAVVAIAPGGRGIYIAGRPGSHSQRATANVSVVPRPVAPPTAVRFHTPQVDLSADSLRIDAGGQLFTAGGSGVSVHSDPGTADKYTTLELTWQERGVEMRMNIYFASDGLRWWATEIRTYNGKSPGDWIEYTGTFFRTPLGHAFTGNVDLRADDGHGRLRLANLHLQPFLPPEG